MTFCPSGIVSTICCVNSAFCSRLAYSTWDSFYLGVCLLGICPLESLATWHSAQFGVSTNGSVNSGFCSRLALLTWDYVCEGIFLFKIMYSWHSVYIGVWLRGFCSLGGMPIWQSVHKVLFPWYGLSNLVGLTFSSLRLWICPTRCLSSWIWSTLESGHMTFCPRRIVSTIGSVNSAFRSYLVLSSWKFVQLGVCLLEFCLLASLATRHSAHVGLCLLLILSTMGSAHVWLCLL